MKGQSDTDVSSISETYDWSSTLPSTAVVETVSRALDREATEMARLYDSIDTDGLDTIMESTDGATTIAFSYAELLVTVHGCGTVDVTHDGPAAR